MLMKRFVPVLIVLGNEVVSDDEDTVDCEDALAVEALLELAVGVHAVVSLYLGWYVHLPPA